MISDLGSVAFWERFCRVSMAVLQPVFDATLRGSDEIIGVDDVSIWRSR